MKKVTVIVGVVAVVAVIVVALCQIADHPNDLNNIFDIDSNSSSLEIAQQLYTTDDKILRSATWTLLSRNTAIDQDAMDVIIQWCQSDFFDDDRSLQYADIAGVNPLVSEQAIIEVCRNSINDVFEQHSVLW